MLGVGEADAPDVAQGAVVEVEPAEREPVLDGVELRDAVLVQRRERVPLAAVLRRARRAGPPDLVEACSGGRPQLVEARVEGVHDLLLEPELVVASHAVPSSTCGAPPARPSIMAYDRPPGAAARRVPVHRPGRTRACG